MTRPLPTFIYYNGSPETFRTKETASVLVDIIELIQYRQRSALRKLKVQRTELVYMVPDSWSWWHRTKISIHLTYLLNIKYGVNCTIDFRHQKATP